MSILKLSYFVNLVYCYISFIAVVMTWLSSEPQLRVLRKQLLYLAEATSGLAQDGELGGLGQGLLPLTTLGVLVGLP